jgi:molecular chaperone GrpE
MELEKTSAQVADLTDRYQRLMAEFENARKRMDKEKGQMFDIGAKSVLEKLLPVIDNFERGLSVISDEDKDSPFVQGIEKIYQQMMTVITDVGVSPIEATGKPFNPDLHNAVMHVEDEELGENVVAEEFPQGYMDKDNVLRYSMVKVAN